MGEENMVRDVLPTIDMQESPFPYSKLREACEQWGCFRVSNHRLTKTLMSEMRALSSSLFDLPLEIKKRNTCSGPGRGVGYIGSETIQTAKFEALGLTPTDIQPFCTHLQLSSLKREMLGEYNGLSRELIDDIAKKMATSLGVGESDHFNDWYCHMKFNRYNYTPDTPLGSIAVGSHTDTGLFTLLQDDQLVGGLEIYRRGSYVPVEPSSAGHLLVIIGDMGVAWSNGKFTNPKHRIMHSEASPRFTIVTFFEGPNDTEVEVEAPQELFTKDSPRVYRPINYQEYAQIRNADKKSYANGETLSLYRIQS